MLNIINLTKKYGDREVLKGISFDVNKGQILGFLGPNGAGKSTTIKILSTGLKASSGQIEFHGKDIMTFKKQYKSRIGIVPQNLAIFEDLPAIENVKTFGGFYGLKHKDLARKAEEVLDMVGLLDRAKDLPKTFSGGMKRRLNIACALTHEPELIILDEPTVGIDPQSRNHILQFVKQLRENGTTIIYTTHYMEEVEAICDSVIIVDRGEIIARGTLDDLKRKVDDDIIYSIDGIGLDAVDLQRILLIEGVKSAELNNKLIVITYKGADSLDKIIFELVNKGVKIKNLEVEEQNLENIFLNLTGRRLRD